MSLWQDIQPWIDSETGLMTSADGGRDNLILMSSYLYLELLSNGEYQDAITLAQRCVRFIGTTVVTPGLYKKLPNSTDDNTEDNMVGNCYMSSDTAAKIKTRWDYHLSCFDVNYPNKFAFNRNFFARFIGLKAFIVASAGVKPWFFQRWLWSLSAVFSVWISKGASDPLKLMLQCVVMEKYCPKTVAYWHRHNSVSDLYSQYFGPNHPLTIYSKKQLTIAN